jgi:hypothetical protein
MGHGAGSKPPKRRWRVSRLSVRGRSWSPARRNMTVQARILEKALQRAPRKAEVDLRRGTGVSLVIELSRPEAGHHFQASTLPAPNGEDRERVEDEGSITIGGRK